MQKFETPEEMSELIRSSYCIDEFDKEKIQSAAKILTDPR